MLLGITVKFCSWLNVVSSTKFNEFLNISVPKWKTLHVFRNKNCMKILYRVGVFVYLFKDRFSSHIVTLKAF